MFLIDLIRLDFEDRCKYRSVAHTHARVCVRASVRAREWEMIVFYVFVCLMAAPALKHGPLYLPLCIHSAFHHLKQQLSFFFSLPNVHLEKQCLNTIMMAAVNMTPSLGARSFFFYWLWSDELSARGGKKINKCNQRWLLEEIYITNCLGAQ